MDFTLDQDRQSIIEAVNRVCAAYPDEYWRERDRTGTFPEEFVADMAAGGWLGIALPEDVGGSGLGVLETSLMMRTVAESGAAMQGVSAIHVNLFGPLPLALFGTPEQKHHHLPRLISGEDRMCFGVTEPNSGLDTSSIQTKAELDGNGYVINGRKIWTTTAQTANKILLIARTTPREKCAKPTEGMSLFYTDMNRDFIDAQVIEKMGRKSVECNTVFIDGLRVPLEDRVGEEGKGFQYLIHGLNPERILFGIEAVGIGRAALRKAVQYAKEREVFGRPIGMNQGVQHPLARSWAELEAAELLALKAAALFDANQPCGAEANAAKLMGSEAGYHACERAILAHGGMGYAKEYDVERYFREVMITRIAPVSTEMILNFIGERVLGLPRSY
ncbi:MAG: acyl-CoA dehydrogenase family protein [Alphaproteobacteria bacterium]